MSEQLVCAECGMVARDQADGWKAEIGDDVRDHDAPEVVILCPDCWEREFGDR
jgi:hypothetical protein